VPQLFARRVFRQRPPRRLLRLDSGLDSRGYSRRGNSEPLALVDPTKFDA
jgi:hypothetical protein